MAELFDKFPHIESEKLIIKKMSESDVEALSRISNNAAVYRYIGPFLQEKNERFLQTAIKNLGGRDFDKRKRIIAGIYLRDSPDQLVGLAKMFDYKSKTNTITIGYRLNEKYWHQGIATETIRLMVQYLKALGIGTIQAYVMPKNVYSARALLKNGFVKINEMVQQSNWAGQASVNTERYIYTPNTKRN